VGSSKKTVVWPNGDTAASARSLCRPKLPAGRDFANRREQDLIAAQAKLSFFSRYLRIHLDGPQRRFGKTVAVKTAQSA
jgi:hypothetical protein